MVSLEFLDERFTTEVAEKMSKEKARLRKQKSLEDEERDIYKLER